MNRLRVILGESLRSLTANLSTTVAAAVTVLIGMFLLGVFIALGTWMLSWSENTKRQLLVKVYFCTAGECGREATDAEINATRVRLLQMDEVKDAKFVSKEEALDIMREREPELVKGISTNPLPASYEVTPNRAEDVAVIARTVEGWNLAAVSEVDYGKRVADRVLEVAAVISSIFLVAAILLVIASTLLIANTIRLSIFARRREIEVMKLVGASNWFVRGPFMVEGVLCGVFGSVVAVVLLLLGKELALPTVLGRIDEDGVGAIPFLWNAAILLGIGLLLGAAGSGLTLRRFLRV